MHFSAISTALTLLLAVFTLLPLWRHEAWWVRGFDFPRLQFVVMAIFLLLVNLLLLDIPSTSGLLVISINLMCLLIQAWWIIPYTRLFPAEVKSAITATVENRIDIITANVLTPNRNAQGLIDQVQRYKPDILVTLESDLWWQTQLQELESDYPHTVKCPLDNLYGMHVYSRLEVSDDRIEYLIEDEVPSIHLQVKLRNGTKVRLHFLHPAPPSPTENSESSERDAELIVVAKSVSNSDQPTIVTGDLNDVAWSETTRLFRKISGLLDPRVGRGIYNSFHADYWFLRWPLDHLFHSGHFKLYDIRRLAPFGSDHFAILTSLVFQPEDKSNPQGLDAGTEDHDWAEEKLDQIDEKTGKVSELK